MNNVYWRNSFKENDLKTGDVDILKEHECAKCGEWMTTGNDWVVFENCGLWFHERCSSLPEQIWSYMEDEITFFTFVTFVSPIKHSVRCYSPPL